MVGQNIGKYRVLDRVGRGGMGTVYRAIDETLHREVAVKVLNAELNDPEVAKRFRAEAITVARLSHPGIATIYELFQHDGQWLMVMEFVRGETLEHLVERSGSLPAERAAEICSQSLTALAHAHAMGVVHRDLKPANIMLTEGGAIKIMDFGIARVAGTEHLTNVGFMMGTPAYMAPEQVLGHETDARADIYAMGVVFYRLLTGQLPFKGETPFAMAQAQVNNPPTPVRMVRADLPPWVDEVMTRSLAKKPDERFQSAIEFRDGLVRYIGASPTPSGAMSASQPIPVPAAPVSGEFAQTMLSTPRTGTAGVPAPAAAPPSGAYAGDSSGVAPTVVAPSSGAVPRPEVDRQASGSMLQPGVVPQPSGAVPAAWPSGTLPVPQSSGGEAATMMSSGGMPAWHQVPPSQSGAVPMASGAIPAPHVAPSQPSQPVPVFVPPVASEPPKKSSSTTIVAVAAGIVVLGGLGAYFALRQPAAPPAVVEPQPPTPPAVVDPAAASATAAPTPDASAGGDPATSTAGGPVSVPAGGSSRGGATAPAGTAVQPGTAARGPAAVPPTGVAPTAPVPAERGGAADPAGAIDPVTGRRGDPAAGRATATAAAGRRGTAPTDDPLLAVTDVRVMAVDGKKATDVEVLLNFGNGQVVLLNRRSGTQIATVPYRNLLGATYIRARDPKWNATLPSPPTDLDVGGMLRTSKHWLTLQGKDGYHILRLEDANVIRVLQNLEIRTGITVDRPRSNDRD